MKMGKVRGWKCRGIAMLHVEEGKSLTGRNIHDLFNFFCLLHRISLVVKGNHAATMKWSVEPRALIFWHSLNQSANYHVINHLAPSATKLIAHKI